MKKVLGPGKNGKIRKSRTGPSPGGARAVRTHRRAGLQSPRRGIGRRGEAGPSGADVRCTARHRATSSSSRRPIVGDCKSHIYHFLILQYGLLQPGHLLFLVILPICYLLGVFLSGRSRFASSALTKFTQIMKWAILLPNSTLSISCVSASSVQVS